MNGRCCTYKFELAETELTYPFEIDAPEEIPFGMDTAIRLINGETYDGPYIITPSEETQVIRTEGLVSRENFVFESIPLNYGRLAWSGGRLTVF